MAAHSGRECCADSVWTVGQGVAAALGVKEGLRRCQHAQRLVELRDERLRGAVGGCADGHAGGHGGLQGVVKYCEALQR
eukprot:2256125-Pleurochrysis_carterae.AAC.1